MLKPLQGMMLFGAAALSMTGAAEAQTSKAEKNVQAALSRALEVEPLIHSVIAFDPTAMAQARSVRTEGPLAGMPLLVKDNVETAGPLPTTAGSLALKDNVTDRDAPVIRRLREAGMIMLGKTNLSEWANIRSTNSISGWSAMGGQTRNPWSLDRSPCGSSSGSGAAVAAGITDFAIGTETDGSVTCPASVHGVVGMKPTIGLVSRSRIIPISASQDTAGPITRTVRQSAEMLSVMAGSDPADPATREADARKRDYASLLDADSLKGARLGVMRFASGFGADPAFDAALKLLEAQGAILVEIDEHDDEGMGEAELKVLLDELKDGLNEYLATTNPAKVPTRTLADIIAFNKANAAREMGLFGQEHFLEAQKSAGLDASYREARALSLRKAGADGIDAMMKTHQLDALISPTYPPAWFIDTVRGDVLEGSGGGSLAAIAGYPHISVPMGLVKGLPVGLSIIAGKWDDGKVLSLGYAFEQARGEFPRPKLLESLDADPAIAPLMLPYRP